MEKSHRRRSTTTLPPSGGRSPGELASERRNKDRLRAADEADRRTWGKYLPNDVASFFDGKEVMGPDDAFVPGVELVEKVRR